MTPWYTDQEVDDICAGLVNNAAKVRYLRAQGLTVTTKPNGRLFALLDVLLDNCLISSGFKLWPRLHQPSMPILAVLVALHRRHDPLEHCRAGAVTQRRQARAGRGQVGWQGRGGRWRRQ